MTLWLISPDASTVGMKGVEHVKMPHRQLAEVGELSTAKAPLPSPSETRRALLWPWLAWFVFGGSSLARPRSPAKSSKKAQLRLCFSGPPRLQLIVAGLGWAGVRFGLVWFGSIKQIDAVVVWPVAHILGQVGWISYPCLSGSFGLIGSDKRPARHKRPRT